MNAFIHGHCRYAILLLCTLVTGGYAVSASATPTNEVGCPPATGNMASAPSSSGSAPPPVYACTANNGFNPGVYNTNPNAPQPLSAFGLLGSMAQTQCAPATAPTASTTSANNTAKQACLPATSASWAKLELTNSTITETARLEGWSNNTGNGQVPGVCYNDSGGHATVGYGHLLSFNSCADLKLTHNSAYEHYLQHPLHEGGLRAKALLKNDIENDAVQPIEQDVKKQLTQQQFDALIPWVFNIGGSPTKGLPISAALKNINTCNFLSVSGDFSHFDHSNGAVSCGLYKRDEVSAHYWSNGKWVSRNTIPCP